MLLEHRVFAVKICRIGCARPQYLVGSIVPQIAGSVVPEEFVAGWAYGTVRPLGF